MRDKRLPQEVLDNNPMLLDRLYGNATVLPGKTTHSHGFSVVTSTYTISDVGCTEQQMGLQALNVKPLLLASSCVVLLYAPAPITLVIRATGTTCMRLE
jgi:hypothetical protein